ncbi:hypothetical protein [Halomonas sp. CSM-2]|uniref:hypothetical protein n=1 Tax=Halomonas sp. CSM-2 TaxID=1975722 RepID=UPI000A28363B|nr:hypothetical protein [Halomonas sp. CSM-2]
MRLTPWIMPLAFAAAMLAATSAATADEHEHEPLDDAALEEEYGIKAGAVKRDAEDRSSDVSESERNGAEGEEENEETSAGTGGSGDANADNGESEDSDTVSEDEE